mgnify:FL=1
MITNLARLEEELDATNSKINISRWNSLNNSFIADSKPDLADRTQCVEQIERARRKSLQILREDIEELIKTHLSIERILIRQTQHAKI